MGQFLSSNTQDFIEVKCSRRFWARRSEFLSSNTQDFIEVRQADRPGTRSGQFLSSNTQDFIEVQADLSKALEGRSNS